MPRPIRTRYQDPADALWLQAAALLGFTVVRSADAYASYDGQGTLTLASTGYLDPDDCLAQMIFHELCHLLVSGEGARALPDWGVDNTSPKDLVVEYATNRLQAALAQGYGLRRFMAVTTQWRGYYDALPSDPLTPRHDAAAVLAHQGLGRAREEPYRGVLHHALAVTAQLGTALHDLVPPDSLWRLVQGEHVSGFHLHPDAALRCDDCAWAMPGRNGAIECRQTHAGCTPRDYRLVENSTPRKRRFSADQRACEHYEPRLAQTDCLRCGACCHRGFDVVEVGANERFAKRHPELIEVRSEERRVVPRPGGRCVALAGDGSNATPFLCRHYEERPRSCREFEVGGDACLIARRRAQD